MAKLIIYRGDVLDREIDLSERNARIGRGDDNDIVLTDPTKSVSRLHAELRFDQGKYSVADLNSQNGVWVAGRRVPKVDLEPGVAVIVGSYKLVLKDERPRAPEVSEATQFLAPAAAATVLISAPTAANAAANVEAAKPAPNAVTPTPAPAPEVTPAPKPAPPPVAAEAPKPAPKVEATPPKPAPPPSPPPAPKPPPPPPPPAAAAPAKPAAAATPARPRFSKAQSIAAVALLLVGGGAAVLFLTPIGSRLMGSKPEQTTAAPPPATQPPVVAPPVVTPPVTEPVAPPEPEKVEKATAKPPPETPSTLPKPAAPAPAPVPVSPRRAARPTTVVQAPPPEPVEKPVVPDLTGIFEEARAAMIKGDYLAAIDGFKKVLQGDPNFPNAQNLLGVAQGGAKNASQLAVDSGNKADMARDYVTARKQYDRALQLDPDSTSAKAAISRLIARMQGEGEAIFARAKQFDSLGRAPDAIVEYEKALQLLPADHVSAKIARERLAVLKREA